MDKKRTGRAGSGYEVNSAGVTATSDGTGSGQYPFGFDFATVTSVNANYIVTLPQPIVGSVVALRNGSTGYELRSSSPSTVAINGGTGASAESAIPASTLVICACDTETTWVCTQTAANGESEAVEAAA